MLPAPLRLPLRQFPDFFKQSHFRKGSLVLIRWVAVAPQNGQATVIVSKKTAVLATKRNRIKRKIRAALQQTQELWIDKKVVVQALRVTATTAVADLIAEVTKLLK